MKKFLATSLVALAAMAGTASAASLLSIVGGSAATLNSEFNPTPPALPYVDVGSNVTNTTGPGQGLALDGIANITFTFLGSEAGYNNLFFHGSTLFSTASAPPVGGLSSGPFANVSADAGGFLPFKFISNGLDDVINGNVTTAFASIAFKVISADDNSATVLAMLNDAFTGDADYDDMIILITAERVVKGDVPLPGAALLLMSALGGLGYMGRSRAAKKA
jgi:hypothetical protein